MVQSLRPIAKLLRSGKYQKGESALHYVEKSSTRDIDRFCCLGVICNEHNLPWTVESDYEDKMTLAVTIPSKYYDDEYLDEVDEPQTQLESSELPPDLNDLYGLGDSVLDYPNLDSIMFMFTEDSYRANTLQSLLICVNDGTSGSFGPVAAVMDLIEDHRESTGYYERAQVNETDHDQGSSSIGEINVGAGASSELVGTY
jgi:hypothetical protein